MDPNQTRLRPPRANQSACQLLIASTLLTLLALPGAAAVRVKDVVTIEGARSNPLYGMGLVVGLNQTGAASAATQQVAVDLMRKLGVSSKIARELLLDNVFQSNSISTVIVTTELTPFARAGSRLDVVVSAFDDASSLQGGTLLMTPLQGADGEVYAVAQGSVSLGGLTIPNTQTSAIVHPTTGRVAGGAIVERSELGILVRRGQIRLLLQQADFSAAQQIATKINALYRGAAQTVDPGTIAIAVPEPFTNNAVPFVELIGSLKITPDPPARIVINERTGTVIVGSQVQIEPVAIAHGDLSITPSAPPTPPIGTGGGPAPPLWIPAVTVADLAGALNALGASPADLIAIFQALKAAGALHAQLVVL